MIKMIAEFRLRRLGLFIILALNQDISLLALIGNIINHFINLHIIILYLRTTFMGESQLLFCSKALQIIFPVQIPNGLLARFDRFLLIIKRLAF